jgi:hypothetical protein
MFLGQFLRELRGPRRVSAVCRELKMSRQTLYTREGPRSRPDPEEIVRMLQHYEATEEQIVHALRLRAMPPGASLPDPPLSRTEQDGLSSGAA